MCDVFNCVIEFSFVLIILVVVVFCVIFLFFVSVLYECGVFGVDDMVNIVLVVVIYGLGLLVFVLYKIL